MLSLDLVLLTLALSLSFMISLLTTFAILPWLMDSMRKRGIVGRDRNKLDEPEIPEMGGVAVVIGFFAGMFTFIILYRFAFGEHIPDTTILLAGMLTVLGTAFAGAIDDLFELRQRTKAVLPAFFAIPLAYYVTTSGLTSINLFNVATLSVPPVLMALIILFGVTAAANGANMLEGYNGLGAGLCIIISTFLSLVAIYNRTYHALFFLVPLIAASTAFLRYNYYPSRVFPGDVYTLFYGATIATAVVYGGLKELGSLLFIPMIVEFLLKAKGRFKADNFARPDPDTPPAEAPTAPLIYRGPTESLTHFVIKRVPINEKYLVWGFWFLQAMICLAVIPFLLI